VILAVATIWNVCLTCFAGACKIFTALVLSVAT